MLECFLGSAFWAFVLPIVEYCSSVWCSAAATHLKLLVCLVGVWLGVTFHVVDPWLYFVCWIRSGVTRCTLIMVPVVIVPVPVCASAVCTRCFNLVVHRYTYTLPHSRTSQYRDTFMPLSASLWNDLADPVFDGVGLTGNKSMENAFLFPYPFLSSTLFHFSSSFLDRLVLWGSGLRTDSV